MRYLVVDSAEFTYPDRFEYESASAEVKIDAARGSYATVQILLDGLVPDFVRENWLPEAIYKSEELLEQAKL